MSCASASRHACACGVSSSTPSTSKIPPVKRILSLQSLSLTHSRDVAYKTILHGACREDIAPIPFYNADVEARGDPEPVAACKPAIRAADALLIATPEYNHGVPAVLYNAIDWASRPHRTPPLDCNSVALMGATAGRGPTVPAQAPVRAALC